MIENMNCLYCKYLHRLKQLKDGRWILSDVCTVFPQTEKGYGAFAIVIEDKIHEKCEMFIDGE